ncbi:DNA-directed DNA polymerase [Senna tora]|uniref:DNA-directed DNA polymerase n=1 Tax=Senna tora TaxID=362788 RepID=A0A834T2Y9_9FABA|nr:DNA-directed DNA polymerase [Senna tora]
MKPERVTKEQIKLKAFPFSLDGAAKEWFFYLLAGSVTTREEMMRLFLDKYFPSSRVINVRRDICGIKQKNYQPRPQAPSSSQQPSSSRSDSSLEDIMKSLALNAQQFQLSTQQFQNETRSSIQSLESQVTKLATSMIEIQSLNTGKTFKVNGHCLKPFYEGFQGANLEELELERTNDVALKPPDNE